MLPVKDQKRPGFINIQQYYVEDYLLDGVRKLPNVEIRWGHRVDERHARRTTASNWP